MWIETTVELTLLSADLCLVLSAPVSSCSIVLRAASVHCEYESTPKMKHFPGDSDALLIAAVATARCARLPAPPSTGCRLSSAECIGEAVEAVAEALVLAHVRPSPATGRSIRVEDCGNLKRQFGHVLPPVRVFNHAARHV